MVEFFIRLTEFSYDFIMCPVFQFVGIPFVIVYALYWIIYITRRKKPYLK